MHKPGSRPYECAWAVFARDSSCPSIGCAFCRERNFVYGDRTQGSKRRTFTDQIFPFPQMIMRSRPIMNVPKTLPHGSEYFKFFFQSHHWLRMRTQQGC